MHSKGGWGAGACPVFSFTDLACSQQPDTRQFVPQTPKGRRRGELWLAYPKLGTAHTHTRPSLSRRR